MGHLQIARIGLASAGLAFITLALVTSSALANEAGAESTADVRSRPRLEYDPLGIRVGSFFLFPSLQGSLAATDNVFNNASQASDAIYAVDGQMKFASDWSRHALTLSGEVKQYWYAEQESEDRIDWHVGAEGRIDIMRGDQIKGEIHYADEHEERATDLVGALLPGDPAEPTSLTRFGGSASIEHMFNRVQLTVGASAGVLDYNDTPRCCLPYRRRSTTMTATGR